MEMKNDRFFSPNSVISQVTHVSHETTNLVKIIQNLLLDATCLSTQHLHLVKPHTDGSLTPPNVAPSARLTLQRKLINS